MLDVTVIIPLKKLGKIEEKYFNRAIGSLSDNKELNLMFVGPKKVLEKAETIAKKQAPSIPYELVENNETDIFEQINKAAFACSSKFFSVLELDDAYTSNWLRSAEAFINDNYGKSVYLLIEEIVDKDGASQYFANEMAWNPAYVGDSLGVLTEEAIKAYPNFIFSGALINTEDFIAVHGLKPSMKIAAWYEFALRVLANKKEIFAIPKIGYLHTVGREDSYDENIRKEISEEEGRWLVKTAVEESRFNDDRKLKFEKSEE